jgi:putative methyltransferase
VIKSSKPNGKKRKRGVEDSDELEEPSSNVTIGEPSTAPSDENDIPSGTIDNDRLTKLSNLQARIVEHALSFPNATHVTYSTCSIHLIENEAVVARLLASDVAKERGWRLLRRNEQPEGLRRWKHRGVRRDRDMETGVESEDSESVAALSEEDLEACLRCWSGDAEGLGGFFVAGFVRDSEGTGTEPAQKKSRVDDVADDNAQGDATDNGDEDEEWDGFSD